MALDGNGHVWVTTTTDTEEYDGQGNNIINNSQGGTGIAIDANGTPWVATSQGLNQVNPSTGAGEAFPGNNDIATSAGPVAIDHAGNIWGASTITGQVFELSSNGTQQNVFSVVPAPSTAGGMGIDANGNLWVCSNDGFLREVSSGGSIMQSINLGGDPQNLAIDQNGSVWVTDHQNNVVDEISSAGASLGQFAVGNSPTGIAIDQAGNVFVANGGDGNIDILTPRGNIVNMVTLSPISGTAASPQPIGLAIDASGTLWVLDTAFSGIHQITSAAQGPQFFPYSGPNMPWGSGLNGF
jgi:streptogramin lyase